MVTAAARISRREPVPLQGSGPALLPQQRQRLLLELVRASGGVRISDVTSDFGVSEMTIRRDLHTLMRAGLLDRVHGGATTHIVPSVPTLGSIGARAAHFVEPRSCVALAAGDATLSAARSLGPIPDLTVVTNSTRAVALLTELPGRRTVVLVGGQRTSWDAVVGPLAEQAIAGMHFDVVLMSAFGISASGLTTPDLAEAQTNRQFIRCAERVVLLAGAATWGRRSLAHIAALDDIDVFLTDAAADSHAWIGADLCGRIIHCDGVRSP
jgi:DeoR/GlpR family transcriptional regulator of sugar metabolism